jgi:hypothetical protein
MLAVVYDGGGRDTTQASAAGANEGLARLILFELVGKARAGK